VATGPAVSAHVVELVGGGLTNPQIGHRLFISPRTVETHLSHVFNKLGLVSRVELATAHAKRQAHEQAPAAEPMAAH
jgi:DNA-binding NarL/FixJ family response regulator